MTASADSLAELPLIGVEEHVDQRRHTRVWPAGMIGTVHFAGSNDHHCTHHFIGLNLSQSGAAIVIAPDDDLLPSARGEISIYVRRKALHNIPFRIVRTRRLGRYLEIGLTFQGHSIPVKDLKEIEERCIKKGYFDLADPKTHETLKPSTKHEE